MNLNGLNKLYDQLTAQERLTLMIAAGRRDDACERKRLVDSAPRSRFEVGHHHNLATASLDAAHLHLPTLLDLAAKYWQGWCLWRWRNFECHITPVAGAHAAAEGGSADEAEVRLYGLLRYHAFLFVTHVEGWKRFCADWPIAPEALLDYLPG